MWLKTLKGAHQSRKVMESVVFSPSDGGLIHWTVVMPEDVVKMIFSIGALHS